MHRKHRSCSRPCLHGSDSGFPYADWPAWPITIRIVCSFSTASNHHTNRVCISVSPPTTNFGGGHTAMHTATANIMISCGDLPHKVVCSLLSIAMIHHLNAPCNVCSISGCNNCTFHCTLRATVFHCTMCAAVAAVHCGTVALRVQQLYMALSHA